MTSPPRPVKIKCPQCGKKYKAIYWPSINLTLEDWTAEELEEATTSTCPHCKFKVRHDVLVVKKGGVWEFGNTKAEE
jgi:DNA-directed RNA polymerase subunit RPC12/RpoP